jgi:hypothetical protein
MGFSLRTAHKSYLSVRAPQPLDDTGQTKDKASQLFDIACSIERAQALENVL